MLPLEAQVFLVHAILESEVQLVSFLFWYLKLGFCGNQAIPSEVLTQGKLEIVPASEEADARQPIARVTTKLLGPEKPIFNPSFTVLMTERDPSFPE